MAVVTIPYAPRKFQRQAHSDLDRKRFAVLVCHRRFGKTVLAINHTIKHALMNKGERPRYGYIAPTYTQAKNIAWDYLKHYTSVIPGVTRNETELRVDLPNGARIRLFGADNPDSLRGVYFDGVVMDEYGIMRTNVFPEVVRPALSDRMGWAIFIGTPNGDNHFQDIANIAQSSDEWAFACYKASETGVIPQEELDAARAMMTEDEYQQEFECSFAASVRGAVYAHELEAARAAGRITEVPYDPSLPVHTFWDLGVLDPTSVWFVQQSGGEIRIIDYYEASDLGLTAHAQVLQSKGYNYGRHYAPHDIQVRDFSTGRTRLEAAAALGIRFEVVPRQSVEDGIHAARMIMPRCWFDSIRTKTGVNSLANYRKAYNTSLGQFTATPVHDHTSHAADAFRYMAVSLTEEKPKPKKLGGNFGSSQAWMG